MRIGIDATPLPENPVGAGIYIIQLIRALDKLNKEHELVIFAHPMGRSLIDIQPSPTLEWVDVKEKSPAMRLLWEQTRLPILAKRQGIDLLHSLHYTSPLALPCKSIVTFHDMTFFLFPELHTRVKKHFFPFAIRMSAQRAEKLIAVSESTRRDSMCILNIPPEKIITAPNGISQKFHPISNQEKLEECRRKFNLQGEFILYVGLLEPRKNLPLLLTAYKKLNQVTDPPPLVIVGRKGWGQEEIERQLDELDIAERVHFTGYVPDSDLPIVYNLATVFVYPSIYEGFGFPPLEAMACGTPVITTAVSSMPDHVGKAGILVPPNDEETLVQAMKLIIEDKALQKQLSIEGRQQAKKFTWEQTAKITLEIYNQA
jgi:glycosyltransferase involved in cell wall biosynthesis